MRITAAQAEGLQFQLDHIAGLERLRALPRFAHVDADTAAMMLAQAAAFAGDALAPLATTADLAGCRLENGAVTLPPGTVGVYHQWCELGFPALGIPTEAGGLGLPRVVQSAVQEICDGANLAFGMLGINLRCAALALLRKGTPELVEKWLPGLVGGDVASTIVISEPQAGSDVGRIRTAAAPQADGSWLITGSKLWISYGDHDATAQILHLVLARVPNGEAGTRGLGLFLVPKHEDGNANGVTVLRLEHKMGLHGSPTCVLDFREARGQLVGEAGRGLQALFVMMNAMRLAVAVQGAAVANAATLLAIDYALERPQGGPPQGQPTPIAAHADVRRMLLEMTAQGELLRALALRTASFLDLGEAMEGPEAHHWQALGELLLPLAKTLNAETAFHVASQGIQVLGGYGYTSDYPLERLARDIRVASIYEGTSGIQALDFLKRKVLGDGGAALNGLLDVIVADLNGGASPFNAGVDRLIAQVRHVLAHLANAANPDDGAYAFLQLVGQLVHGWNGHTLYLAASGTSAHQKRLRAALELFAASYEAGALAWAARALTPLPDHRFG